MDCIIVHYDEIALKGRNRGRFEHALKENIEAALKHAGVKMQHLRSLSGRLRIDLSPGQSLADAKRALEQTFGIAFFAFAESVPLDLDQMCAAAIHHIKPNTNETFRVTAKRINKSFPHRSEEVARAVGAAIQEAHELAVNLKHPDQTCFIEIMNEQTLIFSERIQGPGGLPVGVAGKAVVLMSGGIDSPVAAWYMAKRGITPVFLHFHSYPFTSDASIDKVKRLVKKLSPWTRVGALHLCPFGALQKKLILMVPDKYRIIAYRRFMMRIAERLAQKVGALGIITGEALGQVASQTLPNMHVISQATSLPILRPLVGFDKKEIMQKAEDIETFAISIEPHDDCCTVFMPKRPETKGKLLEVLRIEEGLDADALVEEAMTGITKETV